MTESLLLRREEIVVLSSIYDELVLNSDTLSGSLIIPVELDVAIPLVTADHEEAVIFLPGIQFTFSTGEKYPDLEPPLVSLQCSWLPAQILHSIEDDIRTLWTKELCLFNMIDEISERAKSVFGLEILEVSNEIFDTVIQFANKEEMTRFNDSIFYCEICLEHKKGTECFKLPRCGHISCKECLQNYYGMCITEGLINQVTCINSTCSPTSPQHPNTKPDHTLLPFLLANSLLPSTLSDIFPTEPDLVERYIRLIKQKFYERTTTVYCPRGPCHAPIIPKDPELQVIVCTRCSYAFCKYCRSSWHGLGIACRPQNGIVEKYLAGDYEARRVMEMMYGEKVLKKLVELREQERENEIASHKFIRENTTACPACHTAFQKSSGCNKMTCASCGTKFCYLCGDVLDKINPYSHFSTDNPSASKFCRGRLFEGALENEMRNIVLRRDDHWREYWDGEGEGEGEEEEEKQEGQQHQQHPEEDDDEFMVGFGFYGL